MLKPNRLIWRESPSGGKWYEKGILKPMGTIASGITSIAGKCWNRFERGVSTISAAPEVGTGTLHEALQVGMMGTRNAVANIFAPIGVMSQSDEAFLSKSRQAVGEIWHSSVQGTAKSVALAVVDPLMTLAGLDFGRPILRRNRGILGAIGRLGGGVLRAGTFWTGLETPDPNEEAIAAEQAYVERLKRRQGWTMPYYLRKSADGK